MRNTEEGTKRSIGRSSINHQSILGIPSRISPYSYCEIRIDRACGDCVLGGMSLEYMRKFFEQLNKRWSSCLIHIQQLLPRRLYISKRHQTSSVIKIGDITHQCDPPISARFDAFASPKCTLYDPRFLQRSISHPLR